MTETGVTAFGRTTPAMLQTGQGSGLQEEDEEPILEEDELFMALSQEERDAWRQMMEQRETTLKNNKEKFTKWYDGITRRRMFAYSRMRKLQESFRKRGNFYGEIADLMAAMDSKLKAKNNDNGKTSQNGSVSEGNSVPNGPSAAETPEQQQNEQQQEQQQQQQQEQKQQTLQQQQVPQQNGLKDDTPTVKPLLKQAA